MMIIVDVKYKFKNMMVVVVDLKIGEILVIS